MKTNKLTEEKTFEEARKELEELLRSMGEEAFNEFFKENLGDGTVMTVTTEDGNTISGIMYGNDECFYGDEFYQVLVSDGKVYECFYELPDDDDGDLGNIDYTHPYRVDDRTDDVKDAI